MKKEDVLNLMTNLPPDLIEEADLGAPAKRRLPKLTRVGLIAACLCLALIGTVTAARFLGVQIQEEDGTTWFSGGIIYYPVDSLSENVKELDDPFYAPKKFNSWEQVEEFIGINLMDNPVLDASPVKEYGIRFKNHPEKNIKGRFLAVGSGNLTSILTFACYRIGDVDIRVRGSLFTDRMEKGRGEDWDQRFLGYNFTETTKINRETYTTPNGLEAQLLGIDYGRNCKKYTAAFSLNGVPFIVEANSSRYSSEGSYPSLEEARAVLLQVLDAFEYTPAR